MTRNLLLLTGLLCIAVALGIGIGVLVASLKPVPTPARTVQANPMLRQRFLELKKDIEDKKSRGEDVPQQAWELMATASTAMIEGNETVAEQKISEAEQLLGASIPKE